MAPHKGDETVYSLPKAAGEQIFKNLKAAIFSETLRHGFQYCKSNCRHILHEKSLVWSFDIAIYHFSDRMLYAA